MHQPYTMNLAPNRGLTLLAEAARIHANEGQPPVEAATARELRVLGLAQLDRLHAGCAPEEPADAVAAWEGPLSQFGTDELTALLDLAVGEALEAQREQRPFHLTAHLCALLVSWTHEALVLMEQEGVVDTTRTRALNEIFEAASSLYAALTQEADARLAANDDLNELCLKAAA
ncbi:MAG: hypothetical protein EB084_16650 [Proteobacteria bacterium]|nr:hypothetical protein [Pseudomonadota bacterium]